MKTIWLITHGEKEVRDLEGNWIADAGMTGVGFKQIKSLKPKLEEYLSGQKPSEVHCGTGLRQWQVAQILGFTKEETYFSSLWGESSTLIDVEGKKKILLGHGIVVEKKQYLSSQHMGSAAREAIIKLPNDSLICSGRPVLIRLGIPSEEGQSGALYALRVMDDNSIKIELIIKGVNLSDGGAGV